MPPVIPTSTAPSSEVVLVEAVYVAAPDLVPFAFGPAAMATFVRRGRMNHGRQRDQDCGRDAQGFHNELPPGNGGFHRATPGGGGGG